jgi:primosomal protein N'
VGQDYIALTQRPNYKSEAAWINEAERPGFVEANRLRFLREYQLKAVQAVQKAVQEGKDRFLFEMATGTGKTLTAAAADRRLSLRGQRKFFTGDFARYGWAKLMRSGLGGHETLNLYAEAIARMPENPGIPLLFRDIFKNAFLPYRDPETLRSFLKIIDEFSYDHSERLRR